MKKRSCEICDGLIVDGGKRIYCSDECSTEAKRRYSANYYKKVVRDNSSLNCIICGTKFYPKSNQSMCSEECVKERQKQYQDKHNPKSDEPIPCRQCGTSFLSRDGNNFCTDECYSNHVKEYNREYYINVTKPKRQKSKETRQK